MVAGEDMDFEVKQTTLGPQSGCQPWMSEGGRFISFLCALSGRSQDSSPAGRWWMSHRRFWAGSGQNPSLPPFLISLI